MDSEAKIKNTEEEIEMNLEANINNNNSLPLPLQKNFINKKNELSLKTLKILDELKTQRMNNYNYKTGKNFFNFFYFII